MTCSKGCSKKLQYCKHVPGTRKGCGTFWCDTTSLAVATATEVLCELLPLKKGYLIWSYNFEVDLSSFKSQNVWKFTKIYKKCQLPNIWKGVNWLLWCLIARGWFSFTMMSRFALVKTVSNDSNDKYFHFFWGSDFQKLSSKCLDTCSDIHCSYMSMQIRVFFSYFLWEGTNYQPHHTAGTIFSICCGWRLDISMAGLYFQLGSDLRPVLLCWRAMVWGSKRADGIVKGMPRNPWEGGYRYDDLNSMLCIRILYTV